jgi:hypothetical protein
MGIRPELFDKYGKFVMPSADAVRELDDETAARFGVVQASASNLEAATAKRKRAEQAVSDAIAERDNAEADLRQLRPPVTPTDAAKQWIMSQRAEYE